MTDFPSQDPPPDEWLQPRAIDEALAALAPFYDLDMGALRDDLPLYREYARAAGPYVLELGVGTGRVAADLQAHGCTVVGVDRGAAMLDRARERLGDDDVTLIEADITRLPEHPAIPAGRFDLVIAPLSGLCHLLDRGRQQAALGAVSRLLRPGGLFIADLPAFHPDDWAPELRTPQLQWTRIDPASGHTVMKYAAAESLPGIQIQRITYMYDEVRSDGAVHRTLARFPLRHIFRYELEGLLEAAGLPLERCYASYDLDDGPTIGETSAWGDQGDRLIVVARKPNSGPQGPSEAENA